MKKKSVIAIICICLVLAVPFWWIYSTKYRITNTGAEHSPDGKYEVAFQMVGEPEWPFGATKVKVTLKNKERRQTLKVIQTAIQDDGAVLRDSNWEVVWRDDAVLIILKGSEQKDAVYEVPLQ